MRANAKRCQPASGSPSARAAVPFRAWVTPTCACCRPPPCAGACPVLCRKCRLMPGGMSGTEAPAGRSPGQQAAGRAGRRTGRGRRGSIGTEAVADGGTTHLLTEALSLHARGPQCRHPSGSRRRRCTTDTRRRSRATAAGRPGSDSPTIQLDHGQGAEKPRRTPFRGASSLRGLGPPSGVWPFGVCQPSGACPQAPGPALRRSRRARGRRCCWPARHPGGDGSPPRAGRADPGAGPGSRTPRGPPPGRRVR